MNSTIRICSPLGKNFFFHSRLHHIGDKIFTCGLQDITYAWNVAKKAWDGQCVVCEMYNEFYLKLTENPSGVKLGHIPVPVKNSDLWTLAYVTNEWMPPFYKGDFSKFKKDFSLIKPLDSYYFNVIVRGQEDLGVQEWSCGSSVYAKIYAKIFEDSARSFPVIPNISHPETGNDLVEDYENSSCQFLPSSPLGTPEQIKLWNSQRFMHVRMSGRTEEMLSALEGVFGNLDDIHRRKQKYRSILSPFNPAW